MFIFLDKKREKFSIWLKKKTTIDFSDWSVLGLFVLGLFAIFFFSRGGDLSSRISIIVLWLTAIAILQYTKETYWLKQVNVKQLNYQKRPIIEISSEGEFACSFMIRNIGKGTALNIELSISQIHSNGDFTNLRSLAEDERRRLFNLGENDEQSTSSFCETITDYQEASKPEFSYGIKDVFAVIATYEDIDRNPYYTISIMKVRPKMHDYILKTTKTGNYENGKLEKIIPTDWLK